MSASHVLMNTVSPIRKLQVSAVASPGRTGFGMAGRCIVLATAILCSIYCEGASFTNWNYRAKIVFSGYPQPSTLTNFPVLVPLSGNLPSGFSYAQMGYAAEGRDLRFAASDQTTELFHEREWWDQGGTSYVWVCLPTLSGTNTTIWMFWGNASATQPSYATNGSVWKGAGFGGVWHMSESVLNGGTQRDSTSNKIDAVFYDANGNSYAGKSGLLGRSDQLNGDGDYLQVPHHAEIQPTTKLSLSIWVRSNPGTWNENGFLISKRDAYIIHPNKDTRSVNFYLYMGGWQTVAITPPEITNWHNYAATYDGAVLRFYLDGVQLASGNVAGTISADTGPAMIGSDDYGGRYLAGWMDEARISTTVHSSNWLWTCYYQQRNPLTFQKYGIAVSNASDLAITAMQPLSTGATNARMAGCVLHPGSAGNPRIFLCWDTYDKGKAGTSSWAHVVNLGTNWHKDDICSSLVGGLLSGSNYAYRFHATNNLIVIQ